MHIDLNLSYDDRYPIGCTYINELDQVYKIKSYWIGSYDYRDPEAAGDDWFISGPVFLVTVDDETGETVGYGHYSGHHKIQLNRDKNVYEIIER